MRSIDEAVSHRKLMNSVIDTLKPMSESGVSPETQFSKWVETKALLDSCEESSSTGIRVEYRLAGDGYILVEYGPLELNESAFVGGKSTQKNVE